MSAAAREEKPSMDVGFVEIYVTHEISVLQGK